MNNPTGTSLTAPAIEAILFDMNGTLRQRVPDPEWQARSVEHLLGLLEMTEAPAGFVQELQQRYKSYAAWADDQGKSLSEAEAWTGWIAPHLPAELVRGRAPELMLTLRNCRGRAVLRPEALKVIQGLHRRGYRLGVISNTTSTTDLPVFIEEHGLTGFFEVVVLSAVCGSRKPGREIFLLATDGLGLMAGKCAYVGNKPAKDVSGARRAGFGLVILIASGKDPAVPEGDPFEAPDRLVGRLKELLEIFPPRGVS